MFAWREPFRIDAGPSEERAKLFEQSGVSKHFVLHSF